MSQVKVSLEYNENIGQKVISLSFSSKDDLQKFRQLHNEETFSDLKSFFVQSMDKYNTIKFNSSTQLDIWYSILKFCKINCRKQTQNNSLVIYDELKQNINFDFSEYYLALQKTTFTAKKYTHILGGKLQEGLNVAYAVNFMIESLDLVIQEKHDPSWENISNLLNDMIIFYKGRSIEESVKEKRSSIKPIIIGMTIVDALQNPHIIYICIYNDLVAVCNRGYMFKAYPGIAIYSLKENFKENFNELIIKNSLVKELYMLTQQSIDPWDKLDEIISNYCIVPEKLQQNNNIVLLGAQKYGTCGFANLKALIFFLLLIDKEFKLNSPNNPMIISQAKNLYKNFTNTLRSKMIFKVLKSLKENPENVNDVFIMILADYIFHHQDFKKNHEVQLLREIFHELSEEKFDKITGKLLYELYQLVFKFNVKNFNAFYYLLKILAGQESINNEAIECVFRLLTKFKKRSTDPNDHDSHMVYLIIKGIINLDNVKLIKSLQEKIYLEDLNNAFLSTIQYGELNIAKKFFKLDNFDINSTKNKFNKTTLDQFYHSNQGILKNEFQEELVKLLRQYNANGVKSTENIKLFTQMIAKEGITKGINDILIPNLKKGSYCVVEDFLIAMRNCKIDLKKQDNILNNPLIRAIENISSLNMIKLLLDYGFKWPKKNDFENNILIKIFSSLFYQDELIIKIFEKCFSNSKANALLFTPNEQHVTPLQEMLISDWPIKPYVLVNIIKIMNNRLFSNEKFNQDKIAKIALSNAFKNYADFMSLKPADKKIIEEFLNKISNNPTLHSVHAV